MKKKWNVYTSPYGFALLDVSSTVTFLLTTFAAPFTRFYVEGYLQTVLVSDGSRIVYNNLVNKVTDKEIALMYNYKILSKFFEMSAKLGGVSTLFLSFRFARIYFKRPFLKIICKKINKNSKAGRLIIVYLKFL